MGKIKWKTQFEIDEEKNAPKPLTQEERIQQLEQEKEQLAQILDTVLTDLIPSLLTGAGE